jgi:hypothetical protein
MLGWSKRALNVAAERVEGGLRSGRPRDDEESQAAVSEGIVQNRRQAAAHFVPDHGFADRFADGNADDRRAVARQCLRAIERKKTGGDAPAALT